MSRRRSWRPAGSAPAAGTTRRCSATWVGSCRITGGPLRVPTGWVGRWRSGCSPTVRRWSTSRRSWRPGCGSSTPATPARPTPLMPTRSLRWRYGRRTFGCWNSMRSWWRCGCWSTGATSCRRERVQTVNRLHRLLTELVAGGAGKDLSATQAKRLLATVKPRSLVGKTTRRMAVEEVADLVATDARLKTLTQELAVAVRARGSHLMDLRGIGPAGAARILADVGDVARFPDRNHFASLLKLGPGPHLWTPPPGEQIRHRLSRAGNRRLNHVLHMATIAQIRLDTEGRTYYRRKLAEAKTRKEARRCLKRRLSDMVYRQLVADANLAETPAPSRPRGAL